MAVVALPVLAVDQHFAAARSDDPANDVDQGRLAGAVGAEKCENLAAPDVEIDRLQRTDAGAIFLVKPADGQDGIGHSIGPGSAGTASSFIRPCFSSIGMLAPANKIVAGATNQSLKPSQKSIELLRQTTSFTTARKAKNIAQFRVSLRQPNSLSPG